ncbi:MAG: prepilin-type N-terminal cleavage/methylation domain-containing protein [Candidatus Riflebacteria bacterium]|nr:prepilin-type N-terminal cleavage/methylation domain-containing protein [Candidatus Riflebacteria bacterium]MBR4571561.1 prepilin-type N-terminal cleavage/methylation domain-containing protein [Candidatus Riflebacteria bacterium]
MFKYIKRKAFSLLETLLVLAILSVSIYPLAHIIYISMPLNLHTDDEYMATLLAHHVMETIVAKRAKDPSYIPAVSEACPVVSPPGSKEKISEYFTYFKEYGGPITEQNDPQLYWAISKFKCKVDTYFLDKNMFKVFVYIIYQKDGREMKVFFERLLPLNELPSDDIGEEGVDF